MGSDTSVYSSCFCLPPGPICCSFCAVASMTSGGLTLQASAHKQLMHLYKNYHSTMWHPSKIHCRYSLLLLPGQLVRGAWEHLTGLACHVKKETADCACPLHLKQAAGRLPCICSDTAVVSPLTCTCCQCIGDRHDAHLSITSVRMSGVCMDLLDCCCVPAAAAAAVLFRCW
jgi:hypothetical protein